MVEAGGLAIDSPSRVLWRQLTSTNRAPFVRPSSVKDLWRRPSSARAPPLSHCDRPRETGTMERRGRPGDPSTRALRRGARQPTPSRVPTLLTLARSVGNCPLDRRRGSKGLQRQAEQSRSSSRPFVPGSPFFARPRRVGGVRLPSCPGSFWTEGTPPPPYPQRAGRARANGCVVWGVPTARRRL